MDSMLRLPFLRLQAGPRGLITPLLLGMGAFAQANPPAASFQTDQVEVRLVPATTQVRPGERLTVGRTSASRRSGTPTGAIRGTRVWRRG